MIKTIIILISSILIAVQSNGQQWENLNTTNCGLQENLIQASCLTSSGEFWVSYGNPLSTGGGVSKFDGTNWVYYDTSNSGLPSIDVRTIVEDTLGRIWFGTFYSGIAMYDGTSWTVYDTSNSDLIGQRAVSISIDKSNNNVWVACTFSGVSMFDGNSWVSHSSQTDTMFVNDNVLAVKVASDGKVWVGVNGTRLMMYDQSSSQWFRFDSNNSGLACGYIGSIEEGPNGNIWFASTLQCPIIFEYNDGIWSNHIPYSFANTGTAKDGLKFDLNGYLWASSEGEGLWNYDGLIWKQELNGLPSNGVGGHNNSILITSTNQIWWTTINDGIYTNDTNYTTVNEPDNLKFEVYPNPSNGMYNVIPPSKLGYYSLTVIDINGREILSSGKITGKYTFNLSNLARGVYYIKTNVDGATAYYKIIKD